MNTATRFFPICRCAAAILLAALAAAAHGAYPERPIRLIIAQAPGGNADIIARALAEGLSERLKQNVVADNRPGASGIIGTEMAVRAAPDGYTILLVPSSFGVNPAANRKLPPTTCLAISRAEAPSAIRTAISGVRWLTE